MSVFELASATIPVSIEGMQKLAADLGAIKGQLESKLGGGLMKGLGMLGVAVGIGTTVTMAIKRAMDASEKLNEMKATLAATGQEVNGSIAKFKELAASINLVGGVSKGQTMELLQMALKMGKTADEAGRLSTTALGLSKRLGIDSKEALELLARGDDRAMMALGRHSKEIAGATTQQGKLDAINKVAAQGMKMLGAEAESGKGKWERIQQQIGSLYTRFGQMLLPVVEKVIEALSGFFDWIMQLVDAVGSLGGSVTVFGDVGGAVSSMGDIFNGVVKTMKSWIETIVMMFNNWDLVVQQTGISIAMSVVGIGDRIQWFANQSVALIQWAVTNWKEIIMDYFNVGQTIFSNLATNIKSVWQGLLNWFSGKGFSFNWTPLMEGFKSEVKNAPAFTEFVHSDLYNGLSKQMESASNEWNNRAAKFQDAMNKAKPDKAKAEAVVNANLGVTASDMNGKTQGKGGSFTGLTDFWKKAQEGILKNDQKEALNAQKKTAKHTEKMEKHLEQIAKKPTMAMAG
jgi:hypothetical protein